jgi:hypothetical protein
MLTLEQLITEATALPDADKTILIEKLVESMAEPMDQDMLREGIQNAQKRLAEIESAQCKLFLEKLPFAKVVGKPNGLQ